MVEVKIYCQLIVFAVRFCTSRQPWDKVGFRNSWSAMSRRFVLPLGFIFIIFKLDWVGKSWNKNVVNSLNILLYKYWSTIFQLWVIELVFIIHKLNVIVKMISLKYKQYKKFKYFFYKIWQLLVILLRITFYVFALIN